MTRFSAFALFGFAVNAAAVILFVAWLWSVWPR